MSSVPWSTLMFSSELVSMFSSGVPWIISSGCIGSSKMSESLIASSLSGPAASCCYTSARISLFNGSSESASLSSSISTVLLQAIFKSALMDSDACPCSHPLQHIHPLLLYFCLHFFVLGPYLINLPLPFIISKTMASCKL